MRSYLLIASLSDYTIGVLFRKLFPVPYGELPRKDSHRKHVQNWDSPASDGSNANLHHTCIFMSLYAIRKVHVKQSPNPSLKDIDRSCLLLENIELTGNMLHSNRYSYRQKDINLDYKPDLPSLCPGEAAPISAEHECCELRRALLDIFSAAVGGRFFFSCRFIVPTSSQTCPS